MPPDKISTKKTGIPINSSLVDQDMLIHEVIALFGSNPRLMPIMAELAKKSEGLIAAGSRVGTLTAKILSDGELEIRFVSRWPLVDTKDHA
jgi:hypothetical protein